MNLTSVIFTFATPQGEPIADTLLTIQLIKSGSDKQPGMIVPDTVEVVTDQNGQATVALAPSSTPYFALVDGEGCCGKLYYKFYVIESDVPLNFQDLVVTEEIDPAVLTEERIRILIEKSQEAKAAADNAKTSETNAKESEENAATSETNAANSAVIASNAQTLAEQSAEVAVAAKEAASISEANAAASASGASTSEQNALDAASRAKASEDTSTANAQATAQDSFAAVTAANQAEIFASNAGIYADNAADSDVRVTALKTEVESTYQQNVVLAASIQAIHDETVAIGSGWSPVFQAVQDGSRAVLQVTDWTGGRGTKPAIGYVGPAGIVPNIGSALDIRGAQGQNGSSFTVNATGPLSGRAAYDSQPPGFSYLATDSGNLYIRQTSTAGVWSPAIPFGKGDKGDQGDRGEPGIGIKGDKGDKGDTGPANTLSIGTVATGAISAATITGTSPNQVLNLTLQKGDKGDTGATGAGFTQAQFDKLNAIQAEATKNSTDAQLRDRSTHTGVQAISTISNLENRLDEGNRIRVIVASSQSDFFNQLWTLGPGSYRYDQAISGFDFQYSAGLYSRVGDTWTFLVGRYDSAIFRVYTGTYADIAAGSWKTLVPTNRAYHTGTQDMSTLTGILPVSKGGTGESESTGSGAIVKQVGPTINSPVFTGQSLFTGGTKTNPGISFTNDGAPDTGFFHEGDGIFGVTNNTTETVKFTPDNLLKYVQDISYSIHFGRSIVGNYGTFWRNDGNTLYLMVTAANDQTGSYTGQRPFSVNLASGIANINGNANTANIASVAYKLNTPSYINNVAFDGSSNITVYDSTKLPLAGGTASGTIKVSKNGQDGYMDAGLISESTSTGDALVTLHANGRSAVIFRHVGTTQGVRVEDANKNLAPLYASYFGGGACESAVRLTYDRTINGVIFNGTGNITIADATKLPLSGGTLSGRIHVNQDGQSGWGNAGVTSQSTNGDALFSAHAQGSATAAILRHKAGGNGFRVEDGGNGLANIAVKGINGGQIGGFRNRIINGAQLINQRNFDGNWSALAVGQYGYDRWKKADASNKVQVIEAGNFKPGVIHCISGSGMTTRTEVSPSSGNWSVTVPFAANEIMVEEGVEASTYERRFISDELTLCQRYLERIRCHLSATVSAENYWITDRSRFIVPKRGNPSMYFIQDISVTNAKSATVSAVTTDGFTFACQSTAGSVTVDLQRDYFADAEI